MKASVSRVKCYKACHKKYYFQYVERLRPVQAPDALRVGKDYHARVEAMARGEAQEEGFSREAAMAEAFRAYIMPKLPEFTPECELFKSLGRHVLHGIVDGLTQDGEAVEHKTTSLDVSEGGEYEYNLMWDEQVLAYMALTGKRRIHYDVIKKPTIRLKKDETEEEFHQRMLDWYSEDTAQKCRVFTVERTEDEVAEFLDSFMRVCDEIDGCAEKDYYRNCMHCNAYGRRCEYSGVCLSYDPAQAYVDYVKED